MLVVSMSKQEFGRLEVLLRVQSGRLRDADASPCADRPAAASGVSSAAWSQAGRCDEPAVQAPGQAQQPSAASRGFWKPLRCRLCARGILKLRPDPGGGEAGEAARLSDLA